MTPESLPPRDTSAEMGVIGSILLVPDAIDVCLPVLESRMFFDERHGQIFEAMRLLRSESVGIDTVTVMSRLKHEYPQEEEEVWLNALSGALGNVPHAGHAEFYAREVAECWRKRELIFWGSEVSSQAYGAGSTSEELIGEATVRLREIADSIGGKQATLAEEFADLVTGLKQERKPGVITGFVDIDEKTYGLAGSSLIILAARSGTGKTAYACNLVLNTASAGNHVLFISLEQSRRELVGRFAAMHARVNSENLRRNALSKQELWEVERSAKVVGGYPIEILDKPGQTIEEISAAARLAKARGRLDLVVVDYLQFVRPLDVRASREQQVASISRGLKELAKSLDVPVLALCQMSRDIEKREDKRPKMSDLRESGAIEQDADMIWFLHRPGAWDKETDQTEASVIIHKNRHGSPGEIPLRWDAGYMLFENASLSGQVEPDWFQGSGFQTLNPFAAEESKGDF